MRRGDSRLVPHLGPLLRLALLLLAPLIFACAGDDDAGCTVDTDCPGGFLCTDGRCQPPHAEREPAGEFADEGAGTDSETVGEEPEADAGADAEDDGSLSADADEVQPEEDPAPDAEAEAEAEAQETEGESPCIPDCSGQCSGAADGCGGTCPEGACPGCCVGTVCVAPTSREACGAASSACVDCAATLGSRADRCSPAGACASRAGAT